MKILCQRERGAPSWKTVVFAFCLLLAAGVAGAHPYASGVSNNSGAISYILNEAADDVKVTFDNGSVTNDFGAQTSGVHSFSLAGHASFAIVVSKAGSGGPSQISVDSLLTTFHGPRGVAVNRNPQTRNFGRTYIVNANPGADGTRVTQKGVYVLNADQSDALGHGTNAFPPTGTGANQIRYGSSTTFGPYKISVAADDSVYVADASGGATSSSVGGGVWYLGPDLTTCTDLFNYNGNSTTGLVCVASTPIVFGSLAASNLVLYTAEWNRAPFNNIWNYQIGHGPLPWTTTPAQLASAGISNVNQVIVDLCVAPDGKFFTCEHRSNATDTNATLRIFATNGITPLWNSFSAAGTGTDPFYNSYGMAVSPDGQYVATGTDNGDIDLCQLTNGIPDLSTFTTVPTGFGGLCYGVGWDAADNLYAVSGMANLLRVFTLGNSTIATTGNDTTGTNGSFQFISVPTAPIIGNQPQSQTNVIGFNATLQVTATGGLPLSYQWKFNGSNLTDNTQITGAHTKTLSFTPVKATNGGDYQVVITNSSGAATSVVATLTASVTLPLPVGWSQFPGSPGPNNVRHDDIYFTDPTNGWASQTASLYRTTNGGATWTTNFIAPGTHFRSISFATPMVGFAGNLGVGSYDNGVTNTNVLYASHDGGVTWTNVPGFAEAGMKGLCSIFVLDSQHIYGAGRVRGPAYFIKSTDGGNTWSTLSLTAAGVMNGIMDVYFHNPSNGWVVGMDTHQFTNPPYYGRIARTTDGGATWTTVVTTPISNSYFWKISWPSTNIGYVALQQNATPFNNAVFYKTTNGGDTWFSNAIPLSTVGLGASQFYLQGLGFVSTNEGWIGGASGLTSYTNSFLHTIDGGANWTSTGFNDTFFINRIRFLNPNLGFASGANLYAYNNPLVITGQPQNQIAIAGSNLNLSVSAASLLPVTYQWQMNGTNIGATNSVLTLTNITRQAEGTYSVVITNSSTNLQISNITVRILAAERLYAPRLLPGGQLQMLFDDADGGALLTTNDLATFQVLVSTNLTDWTILTNALSLTNGSALLHDIWTNSGNRFYKVLEH